MGALCPICRGAGSILTFSRGMEWWTCLCGGSGVTVQFGPARLQVHTKFKETRT